MAFLGDDGRGYELARKLEACGVWRSWLGDSLYSNFILSLSSPASWEAFMRADESKSRAQLQLQLRARALLFDKATLSLFLRSPSPHSSSAKLNSNYLQLHGDDVYFTLEDGMRQRDGVASSAGPIKGHVRGGFDGGSRRGDFDSDNVSHRLTQEDFPETWYNQFIEKYTTARPYMLQVGDRDSEKRTPHEMSHYLKLLEKNKRRRIVFKDDQYAAFGNSVMDNRLNMQHNSILDGLAPGEDGSYFFPETMFMNCVPDSAVAATSGVEGKQTVEFFGVLDTLPKVVTKSSIMIERLGIRPEYLSMEQGPGQGRTRVVLEGRKKQLCQEQAVQMSKVVTSRILTTMGLEGATETTMEVLSQILCCHISKLGRTLKVLADSYRKQYSAIELLRMFLHTSGYGNVAVLAEHIKDSRSSAQPNPQQMQTVQSQMLSPQQNALQLPQQIPRQMPSQMQQMVHPQTLTFQHQQMLERMRRRNAPSPRPVMNIGKDRALVEVKIENPSDMPMDGTAPSTINNRNTRMQINQQQIAALQRLQAQSGGQLRQLAAFQMPQMPTQNVGAVRAPPVKVEGFQELMGGDASLKHEPDDSKMFNMTSPSK